MLRAAGSNIEWRARMNADEYVKLAKVEDRMWYFRSLHGHVRRELNTRLGAESAQILDAGCGTGGLINAVRRERPGWQFSGIDLIPLACELARQRCAAGTDIREASITALPFGNESFDAVISADVICQVEDADVALREFFRVLRPGGVVVINVPAYMWMWSYHDVSCHTKHRYTRRELDQALRATGFGERRSTHWNALPLPALWLKRKVLHTARATSDVRLYPAAVDALFGGMMAAEHAFLRAGGTWPWGTSVLATARKPAA